MSTSKCLKVIGLSTVLILVISGCSGKEAKTVKKKHTEYVDVTELEDTVLKGERTLKVEGLKAQFEDEWKAEQERIAKEKAEAERKAKEEAEAKEKAEAERKAKEEAEAKPKNEAKAGEEANTNPANMGPVEKAQWENNHFADVHERANYLVANPEHLNNITSDADTKAYLNALNDNLQTSGEMQTEFLLNGEME